MKLFHRLKRINIASQNSD